MKEMTEQEAFRRLSARCARAEYCEHDLTMQMCRWGLADDVQERVVGRLVAGRYVDNRRYAEAFVRDKTAYNKWGRRKVEQALRAKRIDDDIIREALQDVDNQDYAETLWPLLQQKRRSLKADSEYEMNMKLIRFALGRGFTMDVIRQCLNVPEMTD